MGKRFSRLWTDESGQDLAEYALLLVLLAVVVIASLTVLGPTIAEFFNGVSTNLSNVS